MTMSQLRAISKPPPSATPFTAASIGFFPFLLASPADALDGLTCSHGLSEPFCAASISRRSEPYDSESVDQWYARLYRQIDVAIRGYHTAQKAFVPCPVIMATLKDGSASNHLHTASSCQLRSRFVEFIFLGLFIVTNITCSSGNETMHSSQGGGCSAIANGLRYTVSNQTSNRRLRLLFRIT